MRAHRGGERTCCELLLVLRLRCGSSLLLRVNMLHRNSIGLRVSLDVLLRAALLNQVLLVRVMRVCRHHLERTRGECWPLCRRTDRASVTTGRVSRGASDGSGFSIRGGGVVPQQMLSAYGTSRGVGGFGIRLRMP